MTELIVPEGLTDGEISRALSERIPMRPRDLWTPLLAFRIICCEDGLQAGRCDIRFTDNELIFYAGHIGYMVYPDYRGRHYAEKACRLLARVALANRRPDIAWAYLKGTFAGILSIFPHCISSRFALKFTPTSQTIGGCQK